MADFDSSGALGGAASGAAMGTQFMPGWGTAIGAVAGAIGGGLGIFGGKSKAPNYNDLIQQRQQQINAFAQQLDNNRSAILSNYQNLQRNTLSRFQGNFEASLAGRGLSPNGGAFASGVGQAAAGLQGQYDYQNAQMTNENMNTIGAMQTQLFGGQLGAAQNAGMMNFQRQGQIQQGYGQMFGAGLNLLSHTPWGSTSNPSMSGVGRGLFQSSPSDNFGQDNYGANNMNFGYQNIPTMASRLRGY